MKTCPHCGAPLPEGASFCHSCARSVNSRKELKPPVLRRKLMIRAGLVLLAAALLGLGLWLRFRPKTYDGAGEVLYTDEDGTWQFCIAWNNTPFDGLPDRNTTGQPDYDYRFPVLLYINDVESRTHAGEEFLQKVDRVTAEFVRADEELHISCTEPGPMLDYVPDAAGITFLDYNISEIGEYTAELVITVHMKNGDRIRVRQTHHFTCVNTCEYFPEDTPMETLEELQALMDEIGRTVDSETVVNIYLPPVTYEGELALEYRSVNLYGSGEGEERTTFTGTVWMSMSTQDNISTFHNISFAGGGSGTGISCAGRLHLIECSVTGWETGVLIYRTNSWGWAADCLFENNGVGLHINRTADSNSLNISNVNFFHNTFANNGTGVLFQETGSNITLYFEGSRFIGNDNDIHNRCGQPLDTSQVLFE